MVYKRRRYGRKPSYRRRMKRKLRQKGKGSSGVRYFKIKFNALIQSNGAGEMQFFSSANPTLAFNNAGTAQEWSALSNLFDSFRICAMKWLYTPILPNDPGNVTVYAPLYVGFDCDMQTSTPVTATNTAIQYENVKVKNLYRPWTYYHRVPKSAASKIQGWVDFATPSDQWGGLWAFAEGLNPSDDYGRLLVTYYVKCKDRR